MLKKSFVFLLTIIMLIGLFPTSVLAYDIPEIYRDEVTIRVGNTMSVDFTYGDSSTSAEVFISSTGIDAEIKNGLLYITGYIEGLSYVTLSFNDGTSDTLKVNVVGQYVNVDDKNSLTVLKGYTKNIYIDPNLFDANSVTISYDSNYITVNKSRFTDAGYLKITGKNYGESTLKIKYSTGEIEEYSISVVRETDSEAYEQTVYLNVDDTFNYYVDLNMYNADKATVSYRSSYVSVNKVNFYSSGYLTITADREGETVVTITYDTGDIEYINVVCEEDYVDYTESSVSVDSIEVEKGHSASFYVYLGDYAEKATLTLTDAYATLSSRTVYNSTQIKITGTRVGETELKVSFDDGSRFYIPVYITAENYLPGTAEIDKEVLVVGETAEIELFMGTNNSSANITVESPSNFDLDITGYRNNRMSYTIYSDRKTTVTVEVTAKGVIKDSSITVKYPDGRTYKFILSVVDLETTDGVDKLGNNFVLNKDITVNRNVLTAGYIEGYTDGTFGPLNNITRQEFGVILSRILEYKGEVRSSDYLYDVTAAWSKDAIAELVAMGVVNKNEPYRPNDYITRNEVAEMLYNAIDLSDYSTTCPLVDVTANTIMGRKIAQCWNAGLIAGYGDNTFGGFNNITRAEAVTLINRIFYATMNTNKVNRFSDVTPEYWAYSYILKATKQ